MREYVEGPSKKEPQNNIHPRQGQSLLERFLQENAAAQGEPLPQDEPIGEIPIPDRKKRFKFLRFPKLKALLDQLQEEDQQPADGYIITGDEQSSPPKGLEQAAQEQDDTQEFLDKIDQKLVDLRANRKQKKKNASQQLEEDIQQSILADNQLASERLAEILAQQGKKAAAIAMYQRLSLKFPKKSLFFANKIKELSI
ncbi:hypothetical protein SapgrDRAFT_2544 [Saprospira grandis DSM 2844]|uniref:Tetratricopeptide repeat protein n=1 Tax=Saprospira grandis DSM 2844 TaxID=694433 RepID=J1I715_9BACT|nr:hypothetical protein [Saprospira grandis]EJF54203.1 hypothetical protein SapgrDRAFT_2544 [Saprospira grandis DSM 2844]